MRHPATRPAAGDRVIGPLGEWRVAWVTEGLAHTIVGLVDNMGGTRVVSYREWLAMVHEADFIFAASEDQ